MAVNILKRFSEIKRGSVNTAYKNLTKLKKFFGFSKFSLYLGLVRSGKRPKTIFPILYIFSKTDYL